MTMSVARSTASSSSSTRAKPPSASRVEIVWVFAPLRTTPRGWMRAKTLARLRVRRQKSSCLAVIQYPTGLERFRIDATSSVLYNNKTISIYVQGASWNPSSSVWASVWAWLSAKACAWAEAWAPPVSSFSLVAQIRQRRVFDASPVTLARRRNLYDRPKTTRWRREGVCRRFVKSSWDHPSNLVCQRRSYWRRSFCGNNDFADAPRFPGSSVARVNPF